MAVAPPDGAGPRVLVTGASGDLGTAIVTRFLADHARVAAQGFRHPARLEAIAATGGEPSSETVVLEADLTDPTAVERVFAEVDRRWGGLDTLVNSVGGASPRSLGELTLETWDETVRLNLTVPFLCMRAAAPFLAESRGAVINLTSVAAITGGAFGPHYAAAKAGLIGLTRSAARELGPAGIRVNAVAPGPVDSAMTRSLDDASLDAILSGTALGRVVSPEEVAEVVAWLAGPASAVTGQTVVVDGGRCFR